MEYVIQVPAGIKIILVIFIGTLRLKWCLYSNNKNEKEGHEVKIEL